MPRLFIAIDLPRPISQAVAGLAVGIPSARPVPEDQFHLTLKFIGEVNEDLGEDIAASLEEIRYPPLTISLGGLGLFPPRGVPKVLWLGVQPVEGLTLLHNRIENLLYHRGISREGRKFSPHITLARLRNCPTDRLGLFLAGNNLISTPPFTITDFHLYRSSLSPKGAIHTRLRSYPLST